MKATIARVDKALVEAGIEAKLKKGSGYFYFTGPDVAGAFTTSVMVHSIQSLTVDQWVREAKEIREEAKNR